MKGRSRRSRPKSHSTSRGRAQSRQMHEVRPGLFIGSLHAAEDKKLLADSGITHILTMNGDRPCFPGQFRYEVKRTKNEDRTLLLEYIPRNIAFIRHALEAEPKGKVLVHCTRGVNRSGSMIIAYLMWKEGLSYDKVLEEARRARPQIEPRAGMVDQLRIWQRMIRRPGDPRPLASAVASGAQPHEVVRDCLLPLLVELEAGRLRQVEVLPLLLQHGKLLQFSRTAFEVALQRVVRDHGTPRRQAAEFAEFYFRAMAERQGEKLHLGEGARRDLAVRRGRDWLEVLAAQCRAGPLPTGKRGRSSTPAPATDAPGPKRRSRRISRSPFPGSHEAAAP